MSENQLQAGVSALLNLAVFAAVTLAVLSRFPAVEGGENRFRHGAKTFRYFTTDSNLLAALACAVLFPFRLRTLFGGAAALPVWALALKYVAVCAVTLTLLTVLCFLAPTQGWGKMYGRSNLWLHLICPLLCILSFLFADGGTPLPFSATFAALIPMGLYGAVYLAEVVLIGTDRGGWKDFYGFNRGGKWVVSLPLMLGVSYLIALGQWALSGAIWR